MPISKKALPNHILIIPDGNRRWAKEHNKSLSEAYNYALSTVTTNLIEFLLIQNKIENLSIYMLSKNNLVKRNKNELSPILENEIKVFKEWKNNERFLKFDIKFNFIIGTRLLPKKYLKATHELVEKTKNNTAKICNLLIGYDAETEIENTINKLLMNKKIKKLHDIKKYLELKDAIDLIIRTGKEKRLSGCPMIQSAYAEIFFLDEYYPDLNSELLKNVLEEFIQRKRRYGE